MGTFRLSSRWADRRNVPFSHPTVPKSHPTLVVEAVSFDVAVFEGGLEALFFEGLVEQPGKGDRAVLAAGTADGYCEVIAGVL